MNRSRVWSYVLKYGITTLIGGLMAYAVIHFHGLAEAETLMERYRILADAFTIPGVVLMLTAVLVWIGNQQAFVGLSFAGGRLMRSLLPLRFTRKKDLDEKPETYYEYVTRKKAQGGIKGYGFLFVVGAVFFAVALVFLYLYGTC